VLFCVMMCVMLMCVADMCVVDVCVCVCVCDVAQFFWYLLLEEG